MALFGRGTTCGKYTFERDNGGLLDEASAYYQEIDARRPHWGIASALGGKIASYGLCEIANRAPLKRQLACGDARFEMETKGKYSDGFSP